MAASDRISFDVTADDLADGFAPIPEGWYSGTIVKVETKHVQKEGDNKGKPFYSIRIKITEAADEENEGKVGSNAFVNAMLWHGAHFTIVGLAKALGLVKKAGKFTVPEPDDLVGEEVDFKVGLRKNPQEEGETEVKSFAPVGTKVGGEGASSGSAGSGFSL